MLNYTEIIKKVYDEDGALFLGSYLEIPEAKTYARNREELEKRMQEVLELSLEVRKSKGEEIPQPIEEDNYSGKFTLRIPKSLHKILALQAEKEGISLNQYALYKLSK
ncbi:MAG: toxin-antitoxin system HicB family antitoxin [Tissierellia bacterium]|nr:toxin-antitoxin system HicB family antitoxin [Tissierellia bacterium]